VRKHPIIFGILLLFLITVVFPVLVYVLGSSSEDRRSFALDNKVGGVKVEGFIGDTREVVEQLNQFGKGDTVKAVILRIDSPGGGVASSQEIYAAVSDLKMKKKVVASMGSVAASGRLHGCLRNGQDCRESRNAYRQHICSHAFRERGGTAEKDRS
jgi:protease-4